MTFPGLIVGLLLEVVDVAEVARAAMGDCVAMAGIVCVSQPPLLHQQQLVHTAPSQRDRTAGGF